jgi:pimeloyl-ACP methyl ester carboxylesterase
LVLALLLSAGCAPTIDEDTRLAGIGTARAAPEPHPMPRFTGTSFVAADGQVLPLRKWLPDGGAKAVILALHGFNDYSNAFEGPGEAWAKRGIATYAYDQRGFGAAPERGFGRAGRRSPPMPSRHLKYCAAFTRECRSTSSGTAWAAQSRSWL